MTSSAPQYESTRQTGDHRVTVAVNGEPRDVPAQFTLDALIGTLTAAPSGVAAAVNEAVVPRSQWPGLELTEGDRIEVLTAVQGG